MISLLSAIATYVQSSGLGTINSKTGTAINIGDMHATPVEQIVIYQVGGPRDTSPLRRPLIQVLVRSANPYTAATTANSLWQLFNNKWCQLGGTHRGRFVCTSELGPPASDDNNHTLYSITSQFYEITG